MKKLHLTVVLTLVCLLGLGLIAHAQDASRVVVTVPFDFVVAGSKVMPAGTYSIERVSPESRSGLIIRSYENSALLLPIAVDRASANQSKLSFEHVGGKYFLSKVETAAGVYIVETPPAIAKLAQVKDHGTVVSSGN